MVNRPVFTPQTLKKSGRKCVDPSHQTHKAFAQTQTARGSRAQDHTHQQAREMSSSDDDGVHSLGRLDAYQKVVATADPAACITVHSCAGSGKSSTLAMRARVLCDAGVPTHRILLLTFSNRSCSDLTAKLALVAPAVSCRTHHAHALALLRASAHPQASAAVVEPREQRAIIKEALARHSPSQEKPASKIVRKLLASFAKAKSTGLPQDLPHSVTDRRCFEDYQELLRQRNQVCTRVRTQRLCLCLCLSLCLAHVHVRALYRSISRTWWGWRSRHCAPTPRRCGTRISWLTRRKIRASGSCRSAPSLHPVHLTRLHTPAPPHLCASAPPHLHSCCSYWHHAAWSR